MTSKILWHVDCPSWVSYSNVPSDLRYLAPIYLFAYKTDVTGSKNTTSPKYMGHGNGDKSVSWISIEVWLVNKDALTQDASARRNSSSISQSVYPVAWDENCYMTFSKNRSAVPEVVRIKSFEIHVLLSSKHVLKSIRDLRLCTFSVKSRSKIRNGTGNRKKTGISIHFRSTSKITLGTIAGPLWRA